MILVLFIQRPRKHTEIPVWQFRLIPGLFIRGPDQLAMAGDAVTKRSPALRSKIQNDFPAVHALTVYADEPGYLEGKPSVFFRVVPWLFRDGGGMQCSGLSAPAVRIFAELLRTLLQLQRGGDAPFEVADAGAV